MGHLADFLGWGGASEKGRLKGGGQLKGSVSGPNLNSRFGGGGATRGDRPVVHTLGVVIQGPLRGRNKPLLGHFKPL